MTREEFLNFDMSVFDKDEYKNEKKYLSAITYYYIKSILSARGKMYTSGNKKGETDVLNNVYYNWMIDENCLISDLESTSICGYIVPEHTKENQFISMYEKSCKKFLLAYLENYKTLDPTNANNNYQLANLCNKAIARILIKNNREEPTIDEVCKAGFIDFRISTGYTMDENDNFIKGLKADDYEEAFRSYILSLNSMVGNINVPQTTAHKSTSGFDRK